uniref:Secreted protein n=1 Tax=Amphimedon queenslandica TaxID=400682 RepID=A0A1X7U9S7_AMPQE
MMGCVMLLQSRKLLLALCVIITLSCDVIDYEAPCAADDADPLVLSDPPECNDWSVWDHNPPELCDVTQFEVATTPEVTTVRETVKQEKERSRQS